MLLYKLKDRFCDYCGDKYTPTGHAQKYCPYCSGLNKLGILKKILDKSKAIC